MFSNLKISEFKKFAESQFGLEIRSTPLETCAGHRTQPHELRGMFLTGSKNKVIFRSKKENIFGLLEFIKKYGRRCQNLIVFDKKIGNAIALLCAYLKVKEVYGFIGSKPAKKTLKKFKIKFYFSKTIPYILNQKGTDICPMEKLSFSKTPEMFLAALRTNNFC